MREPDEREIWDLTVATYWAEQGLTYQAIAQVTERSTAEVGRALARVRDKQLLKTQVIYDPDPARNEAIRCRVYNGMRDTQLETQVRQHFGAHLFRDEDSIMVARTAPTDEPEACVQRTAHLAAERLRRYLRSHPQAKIGISYGATLRWMVEASGLQSASSDEEFPGTTVFNTAGDFIGAEKHANPEKAQRPLAYWSSELARRLAHGLQAQLHLFYAPGWIPLAARETDKHLREHRQAFEAVFTRYGHYRDIFESLLPSADVLVTGVGSPTTTLGLLESTGRLRPSVSGQIVGDLSGHLLTREGPAKSGELGLLGMTVVGASLQHFRQAAAEGRKKNPQRLGVLGVLAGHDKADAFQAALELINVAVIDSNLARAVLPNETF